MIYHPARVRPALDFDQAVLAALDLDHWPPHVEPARRLISVAEEDAAIVGVAAAHLDEREPDYDAHLHSVHVLGSARRRGLGRALVRISASRLLQAGARAMWCVAPKGSAACEFYRRLGMVELREQPTGPHGAHAVHVVFGIPDIQRVFWRAR